MIIKINKDTERARSILKITKEREKFLKQIDSQKFPTILAENYYEIIKELANAILLTEGIKAVGDYAHKDLIQKLLDYKEFSEEEVIKIDDLRTRRNKSQYEGRQIEKTYLDNNKKFLNYIIKKLKKLLNKKF